jgi:hypothetical protein
MDQQASNDHTDIRTCKQTRLRALLFTGAAFGTALVTFGAAAGPKIPPFLGK